MTYLITFSCYGAHLPGGDNTVTRRNNLVGAPCEPANPSLAAAARKTMARGTSTLDSTQRETVLRVMLDVCRHRAWIMVAAHVRTAHVHAIVSGQAAPERIMNDLKSYATRALSCDRPMWARHGSTRYLWTREAIENAVRYVVSKQGHPMAVYNVPSLTVGVR